MLRKLEDWTKTLRDWNLIMLKILNLWLRILNPRHRKFNNWLRILNSRHRTMLRPLSNWNNLIQKKSKECKKSKTKLSSVLKKITNRRLKCSRKISKWEQISCKWIPILLSRSLKSMKLTNKLWKSKFKIFKKIAIAMNENHFTNIKYLTLLKFNNVFLFNYFSFNFYLLIYITIKDSLLNIKI